MPEHLVHSPSRLSLLIRRLEDEGRPFALATVVQRRPPVSAHVGDKALVTEDGHVFGWVGGSCSEPIVREEALQSLRDGRPRLLRLTVEGDASVGEDVRTVAMRCPSGGEVEVYIEPHSVRPKLFAVGESPLVRALVLLAAIIGFEATAVAADIARLDLPEDTPWLSLEAFLAKPLPSHAYVVVASSGRYDEEALRKALAEEAAYVALVASRRRAAAVFEVLRHEGVLEEQLARVKTPAGLDIGARTQEEIALSILAEVVERHRRSPAFAAKAVPKTSTTARDPVCGMEVEVAGARHTAEVGGVTYYFCCPHCRMAFLKDPGAYGVAVAGTPA